MVGFSWILSKDGESEDVAEREDMVVDVIVLSLDLAGCYVQRQQFVIFPNYF